MTESIVKKDANAPAPGTFAAALEKRKKKKGQCLLLDVSGSMHSPCNDGRPRIEALREIVSSFPDSRKFAFDTDCEEVSSVPDPRGGTGYIQAFDYVKAAGVSHAVFITDGAPTDKDHGAADPYAKIKTAAQGLKLDIFFVGSGEPPQILHDLANLTGGRFGACDLEETKELTSAIRGLLGA